MSAARGVAQRKLDEYGIEQVCADISNGETLRSICTKVGVTIGSLCTWLAESDHSARAEQSRWESVRQWDELAVEGLMQAKDKFEVYRARELAHHYRWRASKIAPHLYGSKVSVQQLDASGNPTDPAVHTAIDLESAVKGWKPRHPGDNHLHRVIKDEPDKE